MRFNFQQHENFYLGKVSSNRSFLHEHFLVYNSFLIINLHIHLVVHSMLVVTMIAVSTLNELS